MDHFEDKTCLFFVDITDDAEEQNETEEYIIFTRGETW